MTSPSQGESFELDTEGLWSDFPVRKFREELVSVMALSGSSTLIQRACNRRRRTD
jgi:hypothetical protein